VASWLANADPPPGRGLAGSFVTGAGRAWEQSSVNARALFSAWLDGALAR
jgi:hypothetical protein